MEFTGERVIPGKTDPDLMNEHWARYKFAEPLVHGKRVVDVGSGVAYGSAYLAESAQRVVALDASWEALGDARENFAHSRLSVLQGDCGQLPFHDSSVDVVVAFEVIEHLDDWQALISEAARVLVPHGQFVVSTPNRVYSAESRAEPNPFHTHEFEHDEFREELGRHFPHILLFLENHANAITFVPPQVEGVRTRLESGSVEPSAAHFFLAVCSRHPQHGSPAFVYLPSGGNVLREREQHVSVLTTEVNRVTADLVKLNRDHDELNRLHIKSQQDARRALDRLEQDNAEKLKWAQELEGDVKQLEADRATLIERLEETEQRVTERTAWAQRLDRELEQARQELAAIKATLAYRVSRRVGIIRDTPEPTPADPSESSDS
jgi:SAM-dependent methyltransferase